MTVISTSFLLRGIYFSTVSEVRLDPVKRELDGPGFKVVDLTEREVKNLLRAERSHQKTQEEIARRERDNAYLARLNA